MGAYDVSTAILDAAGRGELHPGHEELGRRLIELVPADPVLRLPGLQSEAVAVACAAPVPEPSMVAKVSRRIPVLGAALLAAMVGVALAFGGGSSGTVETPVGDVSQDGVARSVPVDGLDLARTDPLEVPEATPPDAPIAAGVPDVGGPTLPPGAQPESAAPTSSNPQPQTTAASPPAPPTSEPPPVSTSIEPPPSPTTPPEDPPGQDPPGPGSGDGGDGGAGTGNGNGKGKGNGKGNGDAP